MNNSTISNVFCIYGLSMMGFNGQEEISVNLDNGVDKAITAPTNRNGLRIAMQKLGEKPFEGAEVHHGLHWKFREWFALKGLNVNEARFGAWVKGGGNGGYQTWSKAYEDLWYKFITNNPKATSKQIEDFYNKIRKYEKWGGGF